jgi:hypothetical protein
MNFIGQQIDSTVNRYFNLDTAMSAIPNKEQSSSPKASCNNCSDCWRGAVRGSYFRGQAGGGFKPGTTLLLCDCDCHK